MVFNILPINSKCLVNRLKNKIIDKIKKYNDVLQPNITDKLHIQILQKNVGRIAICEILHMNLEIIIYSWRK